MRLFGSDRLTGIMERLGMDEEAPIENKLVSKAIENAQARVEAHNFDIRKQLLDFDDTMNQQREVIYSQRREIMSSENLETMVNGFVQELMADLYAPIEESKDAPGDDDVDYTAVKLEEIFDLGASAGLKKNLPTREQATKRVLTALNVLKTGAPDHYMEIMRFFLLDSLDRNWKEHLLNMDHLREGIGLRGYGQKDPKQEYKREGFEMFQDMLYRIKENVMRALCRLRLKTEVSEDEFTHEDKTADLNYSAGSEAPKKKPHRRNAPKVGRNEPCPCGSGKKYKKCCGR